MKNVVFLIAALLIGTGSSRATEVRIASSMTTFGYSNSFVFVENGVSFAVYPDGEFDFYINNRLGVQSGMQVGAVAITFNSGYNYNPYVQYDDFGAVIQVQQVPVFYDYYGRVNRIGNVYLNYRNGRLYRFGGMRIYYNSFGYYNYHVGYINPYNQFYVYRPIHGYFVRPSIGYCMVYPQAYRRYYQPVRYTYYRPYHNNVRRAYARVGKSHKYHNRIERSRVYKNDRRVVARSNSSQRGDYTRYSKKETGTKVRTERASNRGVASNRTVKAREVNRTNSRAVSFRKESSAQKRSSARTAGGSSYKKAAPKRKTVVNRSPERTRFARVNQKTKSVKRATAVRTSDIPSNRSSAKKSAQKQTYTRASRRNPR